LAGPQTPHQFCVSDSKLAEPLRAHPSGSEIILNLAEDAGTKAHAIILRDISPVGQGEFPAHAVSGPWTNFFPMLRDVIRKALQQKQMSMRRASLAAGQGESYVRDILDGSVRDPGIAGLFNLADALDIPIEDVVKAVQQDRGQAQRTRDTAARILARMSEAEVAEFVAKNKGHR
jgi:hypothetical protein